MHINSYNPLMRCWSEHVTWPKTGELSHIIIQQIVTLSKYGHDALDICHP